MKVVTLIHEIATEIVTSCVCNRLCIINTSLFLFSNEVTKNKARLKGENDNVPNPRMRNIALQTNVIIIKGAEQYFQNE